MAQNILIDDIKTMEQANDIGTNIVVGDGLNNSVNDDTKDLDVDTNSLFDSSTTEEEITELTTELVELTMDDLLEELKICKKALKNTKKLYHDSRSYCANQDCRNREHKKVRFQKCSCNGPKYCSKACQRMHWQKHKRWCSKQNHGYIQVD